MVKTHQVIKMGLLKLIWAIIGWGASDDDDHSTDSSGD